MRFVFLSAVVLVVLAPLSAVRAAGPPAAPVAQGPTRVAVVRTLTVFKTVQENKAMTAKLTAMQRDLQADVEKKKNDVQATGAQLDQTSPNHPSYKGLLDTYDRQQAEYQLAVQISKVKFERERKHMLVTIYSEIESAVSQVATQNGLDLVISDNRKEIDNIESIPEADLDRILVGRTVLFATKSIDITELVITVMDANFAKNGGSAGAAAVPPPFQVPPAK